MLLLRTPISQLGPCTESAPGKVACAVGPSNSQLNGEHTAHAALALAALSSDSRLFLAPHTHIYTYRHTYTHTHTHIHTPATIPAAVFSSAMSKRTHETVKTHPIHKPHKRRSTCLRLLFTSQSGTQTQHYTIAST